jgi:hypothetical protein
LIFVQHRQLRSSKNRSSTTQAGGKCSRRKVKVALVKGVIHKWIGRWVSGRFFRYSTSASVNICFAPTAHDADFSRNEARAARQSKLYKQRIKMGWAKIRSVPSLWIAHKKCKYGVAKSWPQARYALRFAPCPQAFLRSNAGARLVLTGPSQAQMTARNA